MIQKPSPDQTDLASRWVSLWLEEFTEAQRIASEKKDRALTRSFAVSSMPLRAELQYVVFGSEIKAELTIAGGLLSRAIPFQKVTSSASVKVGVGVSMSESVDERSPRERSDALSLLPTALHLPFLVEGFMSTEHQTVQFELFDVRGTNRARLERVTGEVGRLVFEKSGFAIEIVMDEGELAGFTAPLPIVGKLAAVRKA